MKALQVDNGVLPSFFLNQSIFIDTLAIEFM